MNDYYEFVNMPLPYSYNSLEPYIDGKTMKIHHDKHLQTYTDNLNKALSTAPLLQKLSLEELIETAYKLPTDIRSTIENNAGGVYNHRFFFDGMINPGGGSPSGNIALMIDKTYESFDNFKVVFKSAGLSVFGSGYAWLTVDGRGALKIMTTANQGNPLTSNLFPVLCLDVWEHAYYLKHYNKRTDYIDDWFQLINWEKANENLAKMHEEITE